MEKVCEDCKHPYEGGKQQRFCPECLYKRKKRQRQEWQQRNKQTKKVRACMGCGKALEGRTLRWCPDCAPNKKKPPAIPARVCLCCGKALEARGKEELCDKCRASIEAAPARQPGEAGRAQAFPVSTIELLRWKMARRCNLSGDEIARISRLYDTPYNSYGKLRAYIDAYDRLPPKQFLRSARPNRVDHLAWRGTWGGKG